MKALYPGTFDPITNGHLDIIKRATGIFDDITIAVVENNKSKSIAFSAEKRYNIIKNVLTTENIPCKVVIFDGLLVDFAKQNNFKVIIRGLRVISDFEYELQMASINKRLCPEISTIFLPTSDDTHSISSSLVRNIASLKGNVDKFVHRIVAKELEDFYK